MPAQYHRLQHVERPYYVSPFRYLAAACLVAARLVALLMLLVLAVVVPIADWAVLCVALLVETAGSTALTALYLWGLTRSAGEREAELAIRRRRGQLAVWLAVYGIVGGAVEFGALLYSPVMKRSDLPMAGLFLLMVFLVGSAICLIALLGEPLLKEFPRLPPAPPPPPPPRRLGPRPDLHETGFDDSEMSGDWDEAAAPPPRKKRH